MVPSAAPVYSFGARMSMTGKISTLCRPEEYAIIDPDNGGPGIFAHADDFGPAWRELIPGMTVKFSSLQGARGLRAYNVAVFRRKPSAAASKDYYPHRRDGNCVSRYSYENLIAEVLTAAVPEITADQLTAACTKLMACAAGRGWLVLADADSRVTHVTYKLAASGENKRSIDFR